MVPRAGSDAPALTMRAPDTIIASPITAELESTNFPLPLTPISGPVNPPPANPIRLVTLLIS